LPCGDLSLEIFDKKKAAGKGASLSSINRSGVRIRWKVPEHTRDDS
jgi:hypothetical protein